MEKEILSNETKRKLAKLQYLENGGVDNWEGYSFAMEEYFKEEQLEEDSEEILGEILEILCMGVDEPAGSGCGYGFHEKHTEEARLVILRELKKMEAKEAE